MVATLALALAQVLVLVLVTLVMLATQLRVIVRATPPMEEASRRCAWSPRLVDTAHYYDDDAWGLRPRPSSRQAWPAQHPAWCLRQRSPSPSPGREPRPRPRRRPPRSSRRGTPRGCSRRRRRRSRPRSRGGASSRATSRAKRGEVPRTTRRRARRSGARGRARVAASERRFPRTAVGVFPTALNGSAASAAPRSSHTRVFADGPSARRVRSG